MFLLPAAKSSLLHWKVISRFSDFADLSAGSLDSTKVLHSTRYKIDYFGDVLSSLSPGLVLKNKIERNKSKHASVTK